MHATSILQLSLAAALLAGCAANTPPLPMIPPALSAAQRLDAQLGLAATARHDADAAASRAGAALAAAQQDVAARNADLVQLQGTAGEAAARANLAAAHTRDQQARQALADANDRLHTVNRAEALLRAEAAVAPPGQRMWLDDILAEARRLGNLYAGFYTSTGQAADMFQLPVIAGALGASLLALDAARLSGDKAKSAARDAAGIGLGIAAFTAGRDRLHPRGLTALYLGGHQAMGCIVGQGIRFTAPETLAGHGRMLAARHQVDGTRADLAALVKAVPAAQKADPGVAAVLALADARMELATRALAAADGELGHFARREQIFWTALSDSAASVANGTAQKTDLEFDTLVAAWKPPEPAPAPEPAVPDADNAENPALRSQQAAARREATLQLLISLSARLDADRRALETITAGQRYSQWLQDVLDCRKHAAPA